MGNLLEICSSKNKITRDFSLYKESILDYNQFYVILQDENGKKRSFSYAIDIHDQIHEFFRDAIYPQFTLSVHDNIIYVVTVNKRAMILSTQVSPRSTGWQVNKN